jgi:hypothetical protein
MAITYTFPSDSKIPALRGLVATGGKFTTILQQGKRVDAVAFETRIGSQYLVAVVAGKPELESLLAAHRADEAARKASVKQAEDAYALTLEGQREALAQAESRSYDPEDFPGSARWLTHQRHERALQAFDAAHPEIVSAINERAAVSRKSGYEDLSEFVRMGS